MVSSSVSASGNSCCPGKFFLSQFLMNLSEKLDILKKCGRILFCWLRNRQTREKYICSWNNADQRYERNWTKWQNVKHAVKRQLSVTPEVFHSARRTGHSIRIFSVSPLWKTVNWWKRHCAPSASAPWRKLQNKSVSFITKQTAGYPGSFCY